METTGSNILKATIQISFIGLILVFCSGCSSLYTHGFENSSRIYGGTRYDANLIGHPDTMVEPVVGVVDFPFTFLVDTLYLPSDLANQPPSVDPLKDWNSWKEWDEPAKHAPLDKVIKDDYQSYLQKHQPGYFSIEGPTFYEDGTGRHAVKIQIGRNGYYKVYVFIYDKFNVRTKIIKYPNGGYAC